MIDSLRRRKRALEALRRANSVFRERFQDGCRIEFDPGNMRLVSGHVVATDDDHAAVRPDTMEFRTSLPVIDGIVYVPWAMLFTESAAAEMHAVRDPLLSK